MTYTTGSAGTPADLQQALKTAAAAAGWSVSGNLIFNDGCYFAVTQTASGLDLSGGTGTSSGSLTGTAPGTLYLGPSADPIAYPCVWHAFAFAGDVYFVVHYNVEYFQYLAFGKSTVAGLPGTGAWLSATHRATGTSIICDIDGRMGYDYQTSAAIFWSREPSNNYVHHGLDGGGWGNAMNAALGIQPLNAVSPNAWNSEAILLPLRAWLSRPSSMVSLVADLEHARTLRVNNYMPGQILTLGNDEWKVFPWYRKYISGSISGQHSNSFGWAIRCQ
ncbi:MAG: hypothetical protein LBF51_04590 [Zoogloeaceae bacterium]|jgi:hypothetical protein|nr:hypothetical protein [Zoogloeaceae bacterium]